MSSSGLLCWNCGKNTDLDGKIMRSDSCPHCLADMRCCHGCRHYDPTRRFQCRETIEHPVGIKEKRNMCDFFQVRDAIKRPGGISASHDSKDERKNRFNDLFDE